MQLHVLQTLADIIDCKTARSGRFVSGLIGTIFSLTDSIASALVPIIIRVIIADAGYTRAYPDASVPLSQSLFNARLTIAVVIPLILPATTFILIRIYSLDRQAIEDNQTENCCEKSERFRGSSRLKFKIKIFIS